MATLNAEEPPVFHVWMSYVITVPGTAKAPTLFIFTVKAEFENTGGIVNVWVAVAVEVAVAVAVAVRVAVAEDVGLIVLVFHAVQVTVNVEGQVIEGVEVPEDVAVAVLVNVDVAVAVAVSVPVGVHEPTHGSTVTFVPHPVPPPEHVQQMPN